MDGVLIKPGDRKLAMRNEEMGGNRKWCTQKWEQIFKGGEVTEPA